MIFSLSYKNDIFFDVGTKYKEWRFIASNTKPTPLTNGVEMGSDMLAYNLAVIFVKMIEM